MPKQTAVTLFRELIESGKNFGDFILGNPSGPICPYMDSETHNGGGVPLVPVSTLLPRQGRFSVVQHHPAPSKNCESQSRQNGAIAVYSKCSKSKKLLQDMSRRPNRVNTLKHQPCGQ
jgi:hypothetical protein